MRAASAITAHTRNREVVTVDVKVVLRTYFVHDGLEERGRHFNRATTGGTQEMSVYGTGEVVHRGSPAQVGVHHDAEILQFFEIAVHRRRARFGGSQLNHARQGFHGQVVACVDQGFDERSLRRSDAPPGGANRVENVIDAPRCFIHRRQPTVAA